jgi:hypothetical protein
LSNLISEQARFQIAPRCRALGGRAAVVVQGRKERKLAYLRGSGGGQLRAPQVKTATTLPLVVAVTYLGVRTGDMLPENASALVGASVITVTVFPPVALLLRSKSEEARPDGVAAIVARRVADLASSQFSRFIVFFSQKIWGKR